MTSAGVNRNGELHELTIDELEQAGGGLLPLLALAPYFLGGLVVGAGIGYLLFVKRGSPRPRYVTLLPGCLAGRKE